MRIVAAVGAASVEVVAAVGAASVEVVAAAGGASVRAAVGVDAGVVLVEINSVGIEGVVAAVIGCPDVISISSSSGAPSVGLTFVRSNGKMPASWKPLTP